MAGTYDGGKAAAATNKSKYGPDFYARIGVLGGRSGHTGGFASNRARASWAGAIGGRKSKRTPMTEEEWVKYQQEHSVCRRGHAYTVDNVYLNPKKPRGRQCKACRTLSRNKRIIEERIKGTRI